MLLLARLFAPDDLIAPAEPWCAPRVSRSGCKNLGVTGGPGPELPGVLDLRGRTTLAEAAAVIRACRCYVGIDFGLMWIAGSLKVPVVGLYGRSYVLLTGAIHPVNPNARYLQVEGPLRHPGP